MGDSQGRSNLLIQERGLPPQDLFSGWGGGWSHSGRGIWDDTRRPAAEWTSMMVSTVSNRTALPALRLVSVLVAT